MSATAIAAPPLSAQLRTLVMNAASEATLTCTFAPGGRLRGAGIPGPNHCVNCNQPRMWHVVAAAIAEAEWTEALRAAGVRRGGIFDDVANR